MNGLYIRAMDEKRFAVAALASTELELERDLDADERRRLAELAPHVQERIKYLSEIGPSVRFAFAPPAIDEGAWRKTMKAEAHRALGAAAAALAEVEPWELGEIESAMRAMLEREELSARKGLQPVRVAVTGSNVSPPLFESLAAVERDVVLHRLEQALARLRLDQNDGAGAE